jgi:RND family efflux transporter MFP subunit
MTMSTTMNKTPLSAFALAMAVSTAWAQTAWAQTAETKPAAAAAAGTKAALTVNVVSPRAGQWTSTLPLNGNIAAWGEAIIGSQLGGLRVVEVLAQVGDAVSAGQLLARLDEAPVQQDLAQARAGLQDAQAQLQDAAANAQRAKGLSGTGALSAQQQGQFEVAEAVARARVATAQASVAAQELRLQHTRVVAPDAGLVSARSATLGAVPGAGQDLFRLIRQGRLEWRAAVPGLTTPSGAVVQGTVRKVSPQVDPQTRVALAYVDLKTGEGSDARAGMFARGELRFDSRRSLMLPATAVLLREGFDVALVVDAQQRIRQTKVKVLSREGDQVAIEGLDEKARVVARGGAFLADGDVVRIVEASSK